MIIGLKKGKEKEKYISKCYNKDKPHSRIKLMTSFTERVVLYLFSNFGSRIVVNMNFSIIIVLGY